MKNLSVLLHLSEVYDTILEDIDDANLRGHSCDHLEQAIGQILDQDEELKQTIQLILQSSILKKFAV